MDHEIILNSKINFINENNHNIFWFSTITYQQSTVDEPGTISAQEVIGNVW